MHHKISPFHGNFAFKDSAHFVITGHALNWQCLVYKMSLGFAHSSRGAAGDIPLPVPPHCGLIAMWYGSLHSVTPAP